MVIQGSGPDADMAAWTEAFNAFMRALRSRLRRVIGTRLTQQDMAELIGVDVETYGRWERHGSPRPHQFTKLIEGLRVPERSMKWVFNPPGDLVPSDFWDEGVWDDEIAARAVRSTRATPRKRPARPRAVG